MSANGNLFLQKQGLHNMIASIIESIDSQVCVSQCHHFICLKKKMMRFLNLPADQ